MGKDHLNNWDGVTRMGCGFTEGKTKTLGSDFDTGRQSLPMLPSSWAIHSKVGRGFLEKQGVFVREVASAITRASRCQVYLGRKG